MSTPLLHDTPDMFQDIGGVIEPRYPNVPGFKTEVPETSKDAAASMMPNARTLRDACMRVLRSGDYTADEIAEKLGESILAIRPRCTELRAFGRVEDTGLRRKNASGRFAIVLRIA